MNMSVWNGAEMDGETIGFEYFECGTAKRRSAATASDGSAGVIVPTGSIGLFLSRHREKLIACDSAASLVWRLVEASESKSQADAKPSETNLRPGLPLDPAIDGPPDIEAVLWDLARRSRLIDIWLLEEAVERFCKPTTYREAACLRHSGGEKLDRLMSEAQRAMADSAADGSEAAQPWATHARTMTDAVHCRAIALLD